MHIKQKYSKINKTNSAQLLTSDEKKEKRSFFVDKRLQQEYAKFITRTDKKAGGRT